MASETRPSEHKQLQHLEAYIASLEQGPDEALTNLAQDDSPEAVGARVLILFGAGRYEEVASLIAQREPHVRWCDRAISALVRVGNRTKADELLAWSRENASVECRHLCALRYGEALFGWLFTIGQSLAEDAFRKHELDVCRSALAIIKPQIDIASANNTVRTQLEEQALSLALEAHCRLHDLEECERVARLLRCRTPIPIGLGKFALNGIIAASDDLLTRLRLEHVGATSAFEAALLAADIEAIQLKRPIDAFHAACSLESLAITKADRQVLWRHLRALAALAGPSVDDLLAALTRRLTEQGDREVRKYQVESLIDTGKLDETEEELNALKSEDDPEWFQLRAKLHWARGQRTQALEDLAQAGKLFPHVGLLKDTAALAIREKRFDIAETALSRAVSLYPRDRVARNNLAMLLISQDRFLESIPQFEVLHETYPEEQAYGLNLAASLTLVGRLNDAINLYDVLCTNTGPVRGFLSRAWLLRSMGRSQEAFASLQATRDRFWKDASFVSAYLSLAYGAEQEQLAHEAMMQLRALQVEGLAAADVLQEKTLDEVVALARETRERNDESLTKQLRGELGWVAVDVLRNTDVYLGWATRTQTLPYLYEESLNRASFAIYATNGFRVSTAQPVSTMVELACPPAGTSIVIEISALITLHQLQLLQTVASHFGRIHVPAVYAYLAIEGPIRLLPHQQSAVTLQERLVRLTTEGRIEATSASESRIHRVDEHAPEPNHSYRIADLAESLFAAGRLNQAQLCEFEKLSHLPSASSQGAEPLFVGQQIAIDYSTLSTLHFLNWLDIVVSAFRVRLSQDDMALLNRDVVRTQWGEQVRGWSSAMWAIVFADARFVQTTHLGADQESLEGEAPRGAREALAASILLADKLSMPVLADDRFVQQIAIRRRGEDVSASFGSDTVLRALAAASVISRERYADSIAKLLAWRYRFIVPSAIVLKTLSDRNRLHVPAIALRQIVLAMHDGMRDPGLFSGYEPTTPPTTCANQMYQQWVAELAAFIVQVWADEAYSEAAAKKLTEWVVTEGLPCTSRQFGGADRIIADHAGRIFLAHIGVGLASIGLHKRRPEMVAAIVSAMSLTTEEYLEIVGDLIIGSAN